MAPVTTRVREIPTEVVLTPDDGLPQVCAANFDHVFTLRRDHLHERITALGDSPLEQICAACRFAAGC